MSSRLASLSLALLLAGCSGGEPIETGAPTAPPVDEAAYAEHMDRARALAAQGEIDQAVAQCARAMAAAPLREEPFRMTSELHLMRGDDPGAVEIFGAAARGFPTSPHPLYFRGYHEFRMNRWDAALTSFEQAAALAPDSAEYSFRRGLVHHALGDFESSREQLAEAHGLDPDNPLYAARLARSLRITGDYDGARALIAEALRRNDSSPDLHAAKGQLDLREGRYDEAEASLRRAAELDPRVVQPWTDLGRVYQATGREREARMASLKAGRIGFYQAERDRLSRLRLASPDDTALALELAELDLSEGNVRDALQGFEQAGESERARAGRAAALLESGRHQEADRLLAGLGDTGPWTLLARAADDLLHQRRGEAAARIERALAAAPEGAPFLRRSADLWLSLGESDRALELLERAARIAGAGDGEPMRTDSP